LDHTVQGAYAAAAGAAKALGLLREQIANAIAISGTANNALRVACTGACRIGKGSPIPTPRWQQLSLRCLRRAASRALPPYLRATRDLSGR